MATAALATSPPLSLLSPAKSVFFHSSRPSISSLSLHSFSAFRPIHRRQEVLSRRPPPLGSFSVTGVDDVTQEIVPAADDGSGYSVISALLLTAFVGLSLLTIGVIYLAVQDFLRKRETEKFEEEEAEKKKKDGKKKKNKVRERAGPRGFGQKIDEEDDD